MIYYILTALFIVAYLVEIFYFCRGLVNKSPKEMINYLKEFKKIKYLAVYITTFFLVMMVVLPVF